MEFYVGCLSTYIQVDPLVAFEITFLGEALATGQAAVRSLSSVDASVSFKVAELSETTATERTAERPLTCVSLQVGLQVTGVGEALPTLPTAQEVPCSSVRLRVWMGGRADVMRVSRMVLGPVADPGVSSSVKC